MTAGTDPRSVPTVAAEIDRFIALAERLPELTAAEVAQLSIQAKPGVLATAPAPKGLF